MKTLVTTVLMFVAAFTVTAQNTIIVDNNPNGIGQHTTLAAAITAATAGDIIMLIPSATSYGDLNVTSTGKRLTIAGGGYNGPVGRVSTLGVISLNGGSSGNTALDGYVIGGVAVTSIDVNFVDNIKIKAVKTSAEIASTNYQLRIRNSAGAEVEYVTTAGTYFGGSSNLKVFHLESYVPGGIASVEIATTANFIVSNSFLRANTATGGPFITVDDGSTGMFQNNLFFVSYFTRVLNFGGAVIVTNNMFHMNQVSQATTLQGGQNWQHNNFWSAEGNFNSYYVYPQGVAITANSLADGNGNIFSNSAFRNEDTPSSDLFLRLGDNSNSKDSGSGNDADGTVADKGIFGGLDPMPSTLPSVAVGVSVVPSVTSINLSLPTAATGGQIILKATGKAKKN